MKYLAYTFFLLLFVLSAQAQVDRTKAPVAGPAPEIKLEDAETFTLKNGLKVFVVENHKLPQIAFDLVLDIEAIQEGDKAGYVDMAGQLMRTGTTTKSKAEIDEAIDFIGASLITSSTGMYATALTKHQDELLELATDVLYHPVFPEDEFEKLKKQTLSALATAKEEPATIARNVRQSVVYGKNHPYGELTTEQTVNNISVSDCKQYYEKYFSPKIGYLAIVGDIKLKDAKKLAKKYFASWTAKDVELPQFSEAQPPSQTEVALVDRNNSVQSEIRISYPVQLKQGDPDAIKVNVLNQILGGGFSSRLMQNLREDKAYTYGARSSFRADQITGVFTASTSVRNEVTDSAVYELMYEMQRIIKEDVTTEELMAAKASIMGRFARSMESPQTIARFSINSARYHLPENYYNEYLKKVDAITIEDIKATAQKYIKPDHAYIVVVGKGSDIAQGLEQFGPIQYYDMYGNKTEPANKKVPEGLTGKKVLQDYLKAIGGKASIEALKTSSVVMTASFNGQDIEISSQKKIPSKSLETLKLGGRPMMVQLVNGDEVTIMQMGREVPLDDDMKKDVYFDAQIFPELYALNQGLDIQIKGIENIDGTDAYSVEITKPSGLTVTNYYRTDDYMKIRTSTIINTPQGEMTQASDFSDFRKVNGITFPHAVTIPLGPTKLTTEVQSIQVNTEIPDNTFQIQ